MDLDLVLKFWIEFWFPSHHDSTSIYIPKEQVSNPSTIATSWGPMIWIKYEGKIILYWSIIQFQLGQLCVSSSSSSSGKKSCEHPMCLITCLLGDLAECAIKMWFPFDSHWSQLNIHPNELNRWIIIHWFWATKTCQALISGREDDLSIPHHTPSRPSPLLGRAWMSN